MTPSDQQHILQSFMSHLQANGGAKITEALGMGLMAALTAITAERIDQSEQPHQEQQI